VRHGLARWYRWRLWFEEYPVRESRNMVVNGMQQTLLGLYDLADVSPAARSLYRRGVASLAALLPLFDAPSGRSYYSLVHLFGYQPLLAPAAYHVAHAALLRQQNELSPRRSFIRYARRWEETA
jgi:heparosan-N-sulfate-glucuronate 5-epimerase